MDIILLQNLDNRIIGMEKTNVFFILASLVEEIMEALWLDCQFDGLFVVDLSLLKY